MIARGPRNISVILLALVVSTGCKDSSVVGPDPGTKIGPILFISTKTGIEQLYSMNEDGTGIKQLTDDPDFPILDARWSPDGKKIAVTSSNGGVPHYGPALYVMDADGRNRIRLTQPRSGRVDYGTGDWVAWSPDSRQLAFSRVMMPEYYGNLDMFVIDADGKNERQLTNSRDTAERVTDWSRDGQTILGDMWDYVTKDSSGTLIGLYTRLAWFDLSGRITQSRGGTKDSYMSPRYSTKGDRITFISTKEFGSQAVYVSNMDGTSESRMSEGFLHFYQTVCWSPSDSMILYNAGNAIFLKGPFGRILLTNVYTKLVTDITPWSDSIYSYASSWRR